MHVLKREIKKRVSNISRKKWGERKEGRNWRDVYIIKKEPKRGNQFGGVSDLYTF